LLSDKVLWVGSPSPIAITEAQSIEGVKARLSTLATSFALALWNVACGSKSAFKRHHMKVSSSRSCGHFAVQRKVTRGWCRSVELCLLLPVALPGRNEQTGLENPKELKTIAG
jgi:hypothetical protein